MAALWHEQTYVAFDLETSGAYPMGAEICEVAAIKWRGGQIVDTYQSLVAISLPMNPKVIAIHGITDAMLVGAPTLHKVVRELHAFIQGAVVMAHHAQFDMGFLTPVFEELRLPLPEGEAVCTSLLSRKVFPDSPDHKLQTLIGYLKLFQGTAHRALDDTKSCLELGLKCFEKIGKDKTLSDIYLQQEVRLPWSIFSITAITSEARLSSIIQALRLKEHVQIVYQGGSNPGQARTVKPLGIVRNANDDYLVAEDAPGEVPKRYFLKRISASRI